MNTADPIAIPDGIFTPSVESLSFSPNPVVDTLKFDSESEMTIEIYNITGVNILNLTNVRNELELGNLRAWLVCIKGC